MVGGLLKGVDISALVAGRGAASKAAIVIGEDRTAVVAAFERHAPAVPVIEVEAILFKHAAIHQVAIVACPDDRLGERACAFVTLKPGASFDFAEMQRHLGEHKLAIQYWPERLEIRDTLPATASGKIQKFALRRMLIEEREGS